MADASTYDYVDKTGMEYTLTKLYAFLNTVYPGVEKYDNTTSGLTATTVKAAIDEIVNGITFKNAIKTPNPSAKTNDTTVATTYYVTDAITTALKDVTGIEFAGPYADYATMVATVTTPRKGTIYLVTNTGSTPNAKDEYFWDGTSFELFGTTAVDLSGYVKKDDMKAMTTTEIDTALTNAGFTFTS